jgi:hypothetical protein
LSKHKTQDDTNIKPLHRVGQGPLQIAQEQVNEERQEEDSSEDEVAVSDEDDFVPEEEEELFAKESYSVLK